MLWNMSGFFARYMVCVIKPDIYRRIYSGCGRHGFSADIQIYFGTVLYSNALSLLTIIYSIIFMNTKLFSLPFLLDFRYFILFTATFLVFVFYCFLKKDIYFCFLHFNIFVSSLCPGSPSLSCSCWAPPASSSAPNSRPSITSARRSSSCTQTTASLPRSSR